MDKIQIVVGDYKASNEGSFLDTLDKISASRQDGGIHGGHIHYIQSCTQCLILKAAISSVLDLVPRVFPLDLPELVESNPEFELTEAMAKAILEINEGLLVPIDGYEVLEIIKLAHEYVSLSKNQDLEIDDFAESELSNDELDDGIEL